MKYWWCHVSPFNDFTIIRFYTYCLIVQVKREDCILDCLVWMCFLHTLTCTQYILRLQYMQYVENKNSQYSKTRLMQLSIVQTFSLQFKFQLTATGLHVNTEYPIVTTLFSPDSSSWTFVTTFSKKNRPRSFHQSHTMCLL